jgi:hypothetical protein
MGGLSRKRKTALIGGQTAERKRFRVWRQVFLAMDQGSPKRGGHGVKASFAGEGLDHEEVKVQEGQAGH